MLNRFVLAAIAVGCFVPTAAAAEKLTLRPDDSKVTFVGSKPEGTHDGGFKKFEAVVEADFERPANSTIKIEFDAQSLWADDPKLEAHLKNPDFFNVRKHPKITFESTAITEGGLSDIEIVGKLTMLGETVEVRVPVDADTSDKGLTLRAKFKIDRTKWKMDYGQGKIDNEVTINAVLVFAR